MVHSSPPPVFRQRELLSVAGSLFFGGDAHAFAFQHVPITEYPVVSAQSTQWLVRALRERRQPYTRGAFAELGWQ